MAALTIASLSDLRTAEKLVLTAIGQHKFGAQLFLADPVRFLTGAGFAVGEVFAAQLRALPGVRTNPLDAYELILAGRHPLCQTPIVITALGIPADLEKLP